MPLFIFLLPILAHAAFPPKYSDLAAGVKADKKPYFTELARELPSDKRFQKALRRVLARLVICRVDSVFAKDPCAALLDLNSRTLDDFDPTPENGRVILGAAAAALLGGRPSLVGVPASEATSAIAAIGAALASDDYTPEARARLADELARYPELWKEFGVGSLAAFADFWAQFPAWLRRGPAPSWDTHLSGFGGVICALVGDQVRCDGSDRFGQLNVPPLAHPRSVGVSEMNACALDANGVTCWGAGSLKEVPQDLQHPYFLLVSKDHAYVLDDLGVRIWPSYDQYEGGEGRPDPTDLDVDPATGTLCIKHGGRVFCDHERKNGWVPFQHKEIKELPMGRSTCSLQKDGLLCPPLLGAGARRTTPSDLGVVSKLTLFGNDTFAVHAGDQDDGAAACVLTGNALRCWQLSGYGKSADVISNAWSGRSIDEFNVGGHYGRDVIYQSYLLCEKSGQKLRCSSVPFDRHGASPGVFETDVAKEATLLDGAPCVADAQGVSCVDWDSARPLEAATLRRVVEGNGLSVFSVPNPSYLHHLGDEATCWSDGGKLRCGHLGPAGYVVAPEAEAPAELGLAQPLLSAVAANASCVVDPEGLKCWGTGGNHPALPIAPLAQEFRHPRQLVAIRETEWARTVACVLDDDGLGCWGNDEFHRSLSKLPVPPLDQPQQVAAVESHVCALDRAGLRCWNYW